MAPHYVRFARALALASGIAATPGCALSHERPEDVPDAAVADAGIDTGPVDPCSTCECDYTGTRPDSCEARGIYVCCAAIGPLSPPDLPA